jgi:hypothetical protein
MNKLFTNTYLNICCFVVVNIVFSWGYYTLHFNENLLVVIDLLLCIALLLLFAKYTSVLIKDRSQLFKELLLIGIAGACLIGLYRYISLEINPQEITDSILGMKKQLQSQGAEPEQINEAVQTSLLFLSPLVMAISSCIGYSISAVIGATIASRKFTSNNPFE